MILRIGCCPHLTAGPYTPHLQGPVSFTKLLEPPLHCMLVRSSWGKHVVDVVNCLHCLTTHFEFE